MIAERHAQHLLGFFLLDDETVQIRFDLARFAIEVKLGLRRLARGLVGPHTARRVLLRKGRDPQLLELLAEEVMHLFLKLLR